MFLMLRDQTLTRDQDMKLAAVPVSSDHHQAAAAATMRGRKPKANKKKKIPQRGMGVAKLERLRVDQEKWKDQIPDPITNNKYPLIRSSVPRHVPMQQYGSYYGVPVINGQADQGPATVQVHRLHPNAQALVGPNWFGGSNNTSANLPKELSSIPNLNSHLCFKKKYPNYYKESGMYNTNHLHFNRGHINGFASTNATNESKKGSSRTFLEYEFFPGKFGTSFEEKETSFAAGGSSEAPFFNGNSSAIDLSLKL